MTDDDTQVSDLEVTKARIAEQYQLDGDDAATLLTATDEAGLEAQANRLSQLGMAVRPPLGNVAPREGLDNGFGKGNEMRDYAHRLFGGTDY